MRVPGDAQEQKLIEILNTGGRGMSIKTRATIALDQFLKSIGLMRAAAHEEFRGKCEEFAKDYMGGTPGVTLGGEAGRIKGGTFFKTVVVCGSDVSIEGTRLDQGMVVAPWVKNFYAHGVISIAGPMKSHRALVNCGNGTLPISHDVSIQVAQQRKGGTKW